MVTGMSPPPSAPPPGPEVQKDMISEAMKLEMKQGQVRFENGLSPPPERRELALSPSQPEQAQLPWKSQQRLGAKKLARWGMMLVALVHGVGKLAGWVVSSLGEKRLWKIKIACFLGHTHTFLREVVTWQLCASRAGLPRCCAVCMPPFR